MPIQSIASRITAFFSRLSNLCDPYHYRSVCYRLSSINSAEKTVILHIINKNIFIKQTFSEIIFNPKIIERLSCEDACTIGMYYGKNMRDAQQIKNDLKSSRKTGYLLSYKQGYYKIACENRDGTIGCIHTKTKKTLNAHPLSIAQDKDFINCFDANQACYIGMLAGIALVKQKKLPQAEAKLRSAPHLRVVK